MKRFGTILCTILLLVAIVMVYSPEVSSAMQTTYLHRVCASSAVIRATPSTSGAYVTTVYKNTDLQSTNTPSSYFYSTSAWTPVTYGSYSGYVNNALICPKSLRRKVTTSAGLTIRSTSDPASSVKFVLPQNEYLRSLSEVTSTYHYILVHSGTHRGADGFCLIQYAPKI